MGKLQIYNDNWNLIVYLDISTQDEKLRVIGKYYKSTERICNADSYKGRLNSSICSYALRHVKQQLSELERNRDMVYQLLGHDISDIDKYIRVKRAWVDIVGKAAKVVFGTLDQDDAEYYNNKISKLSKNELELSTLIKEQCNVVEATIRNFNGSIQDLHVNQRMLEENTKKLERYLNVNLQVTNVLNQRSDMEDHFLLMSMLISEYQNSMSQLVNAILFAQKGLLHPAIISPLRFIKELQGVSQHLPGDLQFPVSLNSEDAYQLLKLVNIDVVFVGTNLIYVIEVPLVQSYRFNIFRIVPLPVKQNNNTYLFILPTTEYLGIDEYKQHYFLPTSLETCKILSNDKKICKQTQPISISHHSDTCEVKLFLNPSRLSRNCDLRISKFSGKLWHRLGESNSWLYVVNSEEVLTISCKKIKEPFDVRIVRL